MKQGWTSAYRSAVLAVGLGLLAGCAELPKPPAAKAAYDFGLPASTLPDSARLAAIELRVGAPPWAETNDMLYRLAYDEPQRRRSYAHSRWAAAPAQLLEQRWRQRLGGAHTGEGGGCRLRVRVDEFSQVFADAGTSRAVFEGGALLVDADGGVRGRLRLSLGTPAGPDAASGARALQEVADAAAAELRKWLLSPAAGSCLLPNDGR